MNAPQNSVTNDKKPSKKLDGFFFTPMQPSFLTLQNGMSYTGMSPEWQTEAFDGEVVFNTGMTGYEASLTDPSYAGQILVFTYPLIGNYGIPDRDVWESECIFASGVVVSNACEQWSHDRSLHALLEWLEMQSVPVITNVDTRHLTKVLREAGTMLGAISPSNASRSSFNDPNKTSLAARVSCAEKIVYGNHPKKIIVVDCGMKTNILRHLQRFPLTIVRVPYNYDYSNEDFDGVFLSNGPGDPQMYAETIQNLSKAMKKEKPIFGICLGAQLMALAAGAKTYKLAYGHRGHNQPCMELETKRCFITSQNHGYAIQDDSLPKGWNVSFRNLNDHTVEGISHSALPFSAVQFHPEAAPGPTDTEYLFNQFFTSL